ncbi:hypothetical protein [Kitasatospora sp. MAP5-34]|uniref:hypothetical protein n=1 Tax=Kitasatospora sp. MAP5-34 TaxID=3035102 RepID=UPI002474B50E|nr:hypothetical protein [Kitasatospora sp. MAP5-34]MDH6575637.1 hypothetical protein [Kitasatospora sp. MAP5-34]
MSSSSESEGVAEPKGEFGPPEPVGEPAELRAALNRLRRAGAAAPTPEAAICLLEAVARELVAAFGRFDRDALGAWRELAHFRDAAGDAAGSVHLLEQLVVDMAQSFGANDPDTLRARLDLATGTANAGRPAVALRQFHEILPALTAAAGPGDPRVLSARYDLALHTANGGDLAGCVYQLQQLVPQVQQALGEQHPLLAEARLDLARYSQRWAKDADVQISWVEIVAIVYRLMVWGFDSDKEAVACLAELERRTGRRDLADRVLSAPDHLTVDQVAATAFG